MKKIGYGFEKIIELMPEGWEEKAKETGAIKRSRQIKNAEDLLKVNLLYLTSGGSFGKTSAMLKLTEDIRLNKNAVYERINKSGEWLKWLCTNICRNTDLIAEPPEWLKEKRVCLLDASDESMNGSKKADYRLHYMVELFQLKLVEMHLTEAKEGEKLSRFNEIGKKDIIMGDRAYGTIKGIEYAIEKEADYIFRLKAKSFNFYDESENAVELTKYFADLGEKDSTSVNLYYKVGKELKPVRICAIRKTVEAEQNGIRQIKKSNSKKMRGKVSDLQEIYNKYIIVATSLPDEITDSYILELYRLRWQIELVFKRFKSIFHYDEMPSKSEKSVYAFFYGKLLIAAICEALVNQGRFSPNPK